MSARLSTACPARLLGRHVGRRAEDHPGLRHRAAMHRRRHRRRSCRDAPAGSCAFARPKSSTFTVPSGAHLDVGRLQIAMDDALLVRRFERLGDLLRDRQRLVERDRRRARSARERSSPSTSSMTSAVKSARLLEAVDRRDVRMIERGERLRLRAESARGDPASAANAAGSTLIATVALQLACRSRDRPRPCRPRRAARRFRRGRGGIRQIEPWIEADSSDEARDGQGEPAQPVITCVRRDCQQISAQGSQDGTRWERSAPVWPRLN